MNVENQNSAGTTSALAQKTGIKPLAKIIAAVVIIALIVFVAASGPDIEASAKPVVEQIFRTNCSMSVTCTEISGIKEVGNDQYVGIAHVKDNITGKTSKHMVSMEILGDNIVVLVEEELL